MRKKFVYKDEAAIIIEGADQENGLELSSESDSSDNSS